MRSVVHVLLSLTGSGATSFFRFMMTTFGPRPEFLAVALSNLQNATIYIRELAKLPSDEYARIQKFLGIPDVSDNSPIRVLEAVAVSLSNDDSDISETTAYVILKFIIENCLKYNVVEPLVQYLLICSRVEAIRVEIAKIDIWGQLYSRLKTERDSVLQLLQRLKLPTYEYGLSFLYRLLQIFNETRDRKVAEAIAEVLKQSDDFNLTPLVPFLKEGIRGSDPLLPLIIASGLGPKGYGIIADNGLWPALTGHLIAKQENVVIAIAKFVERILGFGGTFPFDPEFFATALNVLYAEDTPWSMCTKLVMLLVRSCKHKDIFVFLEKRKFGEYLRQLPWKYPNDSGAVFEILEETAEMLEQFYPV
jgi:hypothetical protein